MVQSRDFDHHSLLMELTFDEIQGIASPIWMKSAVISSGECSRMAADSLDDFETWVRDVLRRQVDGRSVDGQAEASGLEKSRGTSVLFVLAPFECRAKRHLKLYVDGEPVCLLGHQAPAGFDRIRPGCAVRMSAGDLLLR